MSSPKDIASLSREELLVLVAQLQRQVAEFTVTIEVLRAENMALKRGAKRQAAPFAKGTRVVNPKRPGRKPGSAPFSFRGAPPPEEITEPPVDVPVTLLACPDCGGRLEEERVDFAYITDIPPTPRPKVTQYRVRVCRCTTCGQRVRGQHPDLAPEQYGATAQPWQEGITHHLRERTLKDPDNQRLLNEIGWHHRRGNLLRFLEEPSIEPTNNRAERALRPAVIARKVSQCSKNDAGAQAFAAFTSVVRTLGKKGVPSMVEGLYYIFQSAKAQRAPP